jgi:zonadhesin
MQVNGVTRSLPYFAGPYKVEYKYGYAVFESVIAQLKVSFDGMFSVFVEVGRIYASQLCGLCGNFDDDSTNDWRMSNGLTALGETQFGDSWIVKDPLATDK